MENLRQKSNFVKLVENYSGDKSVSVECLFSKFKDEIEEHNRAEKQKEGEVISKFSWTYLKKFTEKGMFGRSELKLLKIDSLEVDSFTDDWERTYKAVTGISMNVGICGVTIRDFDTSVDSLFTESQLREYSEISKEEFESFLLEGDSINNRIDSLLKK